MDPNETLRVMREAIQTIEATTFGNINCGECGTDVMTLDRLLESMQALDEWLSKGGFLPDAWNQKRS